MYEKEKNETSESEVSTKNNTVNSNPFLIAFILVVVLVFLLYIFGFRITYAPTLESNWEAIDACASWVGVIVSVIAVYYAVQIPTKIAKQQNDIALFERRLALLDNLQEYIAFSKAAENYKGDLYDICFCFLACFGENPAYHSDKKNRESIIRSTIIKNAEIAILIDQGCLLIDPIFSIQIREMTSHFTKVIICEQTEDSRTVFDTYYNRFKDTAAFIEKQILPALENDLRLNIK